ncbi:caveolin-2 [Pristis pectinata]|uniref:caveolin-2 n=1 Tax=Pristis pectinata TaxID=685728 RepID=UPI00223E5F1D|nr:caveolin-2 [Pristis pectinata]
MGKQTGPAERGVQFENDEFLKSTKLLGGGEEEQPEQREHHRRDPGGINTHIKVSFEDVIAEPVATQSFDGIWICSHASFEISKFVLYKVLTLFLAIPLAFIIGILFAVISYVHIWFLMPIVKTFMMILPSIKVIWKSIMDTFVSPLCESMGRCFSAFNFRITQD